jgi:hypothetical protein
MEPTQPTVELQSLTRPPASEARSVRCAPSPRTTGFPHVRAARGATPLHAEPSLSGVSDPREHTFGGSKPSAARRLGASPPQTNSAPSAATPTAPATSSVTSTSAFYHPPERPKKSTSASAISTRQTIYKAIVDYAAEVENNYGAMIGVGLGLGAVGGGLGLYGALKSRLK